MIEFAKVLALEAGTRVRTLLARLRADGTDGQDDDAEPMDGVEVVQPHGLLAKPAATATLEAVYVRTGDEFVCIGLLDKGSAALSPGVEEGETRLYNLAGAVVRLRASGDIEVTPAAGQNVWIGSTGGAVPIALGDTVASHLAAMQTYLDTHVHSGVQPGIAISGTPSVPSPSPPDVQADHAFVQPA